MCGAGGWVLGRSVRPRAEGRRPRVGGPGAEGAYSAAVRCALVRRLALGSCEPLHPYGHDEIRRVAEALRARGIEAERAVWTDPAVDWGAFDACVIRSTWDYPNDLAAFLAWTRRVERTTPLWNSAALVEWNCDKRYLVGLERAGIGIPPTRVVQRGARADLGALMDGAGWKRVVVKPAVGVTGIGAMRVSRDEAAAGDAHLAGLVANGAALVQEYLPSIESEGETSMFYFGGSFSHAIRKRPTAGDYRVQIMYGGTSARTRPAEDELALAGRVLAAAPERPLYARVDTVRAPDGSPVLMELEAIEPYLFLENEPASVERYAGAIAARMRTGGASPVL